MADALILSIAGSTPNPALGGGSHRYAESHLEAARALGYEVHPFYFSPFPETQIGTVLRSRKAVRFLDVVAHADTLEERLVEWVHQQPRKPDQAVILHSFGVWLYPSVRAADRLRRDGFRVATLGSFYCVVLDEKKSQLIGSWKAGLFWNTLRMIWIYLWSRWQISPREKWALLRADRLLVNYDCIRADLERAAGRPLPVQKIRYTSPSHNAAPTETPAPAVPHIVSISRHDARKGVDVLLKALSLLKQRGVAFQACLVGAGPLLQSHRTLARRLALEPEVSIPGFVEDAQSILQQATVFVQPALAEQSGSLSVVEALRAAKPVVSSDCDGLKEDLTDGETALLVPPGNPVALAEAIERLLRDPELACKLAQAGRNLYETHFTEQALQKDLLLVYQEMEKIATRTLSTEAQPNGTNRHGSTG